ncbi:hypothetical protein, partial [Kineococcus indalonis]|uniref:hypothetical protein n=1 Tax=Kineococcus indalonis TaxID=2696566 RepID=UPI0038992477|nr:hypothetical protein [Kineococcus indalonis]
MGERHEALGGAAGFLGRPTSGEVRTPDGRGARGDFEGGSIHWSPRTGAHAVRGEIRQEHGCLD